MKENTSIAQINKQASTIVPKPTKAQVIELMTNEVIAQREKKNDANEKIREKIQVLLDKEIEKFKKKKITIGNLHSIRWENAGSKVYIGGQCIDGSPGMVKHHQELKEYKNLIIDRESVKEEVKEKIEKEMLQGIISLPGVKEAINSTIAKLAL